MVPAMAVTAEQLEEVERRTTTLEKTIYIGNGTPSVTTRLALVEKTLAAMVKLGWLLLASALTSSGTLIAHMIESHGK